MLWRAKGHAGVHFELHAISSAGTQRPENEDCCFAGREAGSVGMLLVADGVSGQNGGAVASQTALATTLRSYRAQAENVAPAQRLRRAVQEANIAVYDRALASPELAGMATTLTVALVHGGRLAIAHVGDSRAYLIRGGRLRQLTKDHNAGARRVPFGFRVPTPERRAEDSYKLTRSLGRDLIASVDRISGAILVGDVLVLCSDGLYRVLDDQELTSLVTAHGAERASSELIERANARGTPDNVSVAVLRVLE